MGLRESRLEPLRHLYHAHQIESTFTSVVTAIAIVFLAWGLLGDERWHSAGRSMWYLMLPFAVLNIVTGLDAALNIGWPGFWDRMLLISASLSSLPPMIRLWQLAPTYQREALGSQTRKPRTPATSSTISSSG